MHAKSRSVIPALAGVHGPASEKPDLSTDPKTVRGRLISQLRKHMTKWYAFIRYYQTMADEIGRNVCEYYPSDEDKKLAGAMDRPGRIGSDGTNTKELTREFIVLALPNRKYNKDNLHPRVVLQFLNPLLGDIDTDLPETKMQSKTISTSWLRLCSDLRQGAPGAKASPRNY